VEGGEEEEEEARPFSSQESAVKRRLIFVMWKVRERAARAF